jgi:hypothetical protein
VTRRKSACGRAENGTQQREERYCGERTEAGLPRNRGQKAVHTGTSQQQLP